MPLAALSILTLAAISFAPPRSAAQQPAPNADPFELINQLSGRPVRVPPRALAVIPERHTGRLLSFTDVLERIDPQFSDLARGAGLTSARAIQLRTREANLPVFVRKSEGNISTVLRLPLGATIMVRGMLLERGGQYLVLASDVRPSTGRPRR